ncbi:translation initiation factor IF-2-like [Monodelphis domestica]|uniref:translation initiation factor IF-2-like n=1 Tax=Monodelphis domestica TaxID=13616 RepID=UPI0024E1B95F|nr:translation initiation factor IF-2-like [Monodelphis domestica]
MVLQGLGPSEARKGQKDVPVQEDGERLSNGGDDSDVGGRPKHRRIATAASRHEEGPRNSHPRSPSEKKTRASAGPVTASPALAPRVACLRAPLSLPRTRAPKGAAAASSPAPGLDLVGFFQFASSMPGSAKSSLLAEAEQSREEGPEGDAGLARPGPPNGFSGKCGGTQPARPGQGERAEERDQPEPGEPLIRAREGPAGHPLAGDGRLRALEARPGTGDPGGGSPLHACAILPTRAQPAGSLPSARPSPFGVPPAQRGRVFVGDQRGACLSCK